VDYVTLPLSAVRRAIDDVARDAQATFGGLDVARLNWRPDERRWSVAQCFEHLLSTNRLMLQAADDALRNPARTVWQRLPVLPGVFGRLLIRSQSPGATRKFTASPKAQPAASRIAGDVVRRFVDQHREIAAWMRALDEDGAARVVMVSPFAGFVTYSVLDGCRLLAAHDRRHLEQARRVTSSANFPSA
jgi:hypothetical protein